MAQAFVPLVASMLLSARSRSRSRASSAALLAALLAVALAARGASGAQLCAPGESTFDGDWRGPLRNSTADDVQAYCPATLARISVTTCAKANEHTRWRAGPELATPCPPTRAPRA
jgi:hypothetical protein